MKKLIGDRFQLEVGDGLTTKANWSKVQNSIGEKLIGDKHGDYC